MSEVVRIAGPHDLPNRQGRMVCDLHGVDLHLNVQPATEADADTLLIGFHGAVDRVNRPVPAFIPFLPGAGGGLHQVAVADPSLRTDPDLNMGWFAGDQDFAAQQVLPELFQGLAQALGVRRTIYFGTSGGGFAALYCSHQHAGSLALVGNPQTSIARFYPRHIDAYLAACWPGVSSLSDLSGKVVTDLNALYGSRPITNYVLYLQNSTDDHHLFDHLAPFLSSIESAATRKRIATACFYPGQSGHSPVWDMFAPWLRAALVAPDWMAETLVSTHQALIVARSKSAPPHKTPPGASVSATSHPSAELAPADLALADLLRDHHLRQTPEP